MTLYCFIKKGNTYHIKYLLIPKVGVSNDLASYIRKNTMVNRVWEPTRSRNCFWIGKTRPGS